MAAISVQLPNDISCLTLHDKRRQGSELKWLELCKLASRSVARVVSRLSDRTCFAYQSHHMIS